MQALLAYESLVSFNGVLDFFSSAFDSFHSFVDFFFDSFLGVLSSFLDVLNSAFDSFLSVFDLLLDSVLNHFDSFGSLAVEHASGPQNYQNDNYQRCQNADQLLLVHVKTLPFTLSF